jgi:D-alanyl-D-alanine carboxypeptidase/D-alanyl-D-alanine-endopeptidase (penicillin-binding protein 4)
MTACSTLPPVATRLPPVLMQSLQKAGIPPAAVALRIERIDDGALLVSHNDTRAFNPASNMKLVTTQAALALLGPGYRWTTRVFTEGPQSGDILQSALMIKGSGDPRFAQEDLWRLLRQLRALGIRELQGGLLLDQSLFQPIPPATLPFDDAPERAYNAMPDALLLDGKALNLRLVPDPLNQRVTVASEPLLAGVAVTAPQWVEGECGDWRKRSQLVQEKNALRFTGSYAQSCGQQRMAIHAYQLTHSQFFDAVFRQIWMELGGSISGPTREGRVPDAAREIAQWQSLPLAEVIRDINKNSNNVMARQLLLTIEAERGNRPARIDAASRTVSAWLAEKGMPAADMVLENGSGLSRNERISAATLAHLLQLAWHSPTMPEFVASLPIAGVDGTMSKRVLLMSVKEQAHIKTGSLADVVSMAGYVTAQSGRRVLIVCMVNHANANTMRTGLDELLQWVFENN